MSSPQPLTGTFDQVKGHDGSLYRKMLQLAVYLGDEDAPEIEDICDADGDLLIPGHYKSLGIMSKEQGLAITPSIETSVDMGYGYGRAIRRDITSTDVAPAFTMKESKRGVLEAYEGLDLSQIKAKATNHTIAYDRPSQRQTKYGRLLCLGVDGFGADAKYHAEWFPRVSVSDIGERSWSEENSIEYPVTMGVDEDFEVGTSQRTFWAGPGMTAELVAAMGFSIAS